MKRFVPSIMLGLIFVNGQESAMATQPLPPSNLKDTGAANPILEQIMDKMKKNDAISAQEKATYEQVLERIHEKLKKAGGRLTALSSQEMHIYNQDLINKITPTIDEILENGLKFPWGIDLTLIEERGAKLRVSIGGGGADLSSVVTSYQKLKEHAEDRKKQYTQEKDEASKKLQELTQETKAKIDALRSVSLLKRSALKKKILEDEQAALEALQEKIIQRNRDLKGIADANETAIKNIMAITKLPREQIESLPAFGAWKEMKAHPKTIPQKMQPSVLSRPRRPAPLQRLPQTTPQQNEQKQGEATVGRRPLPAVSKEPPPLPTRPSPLGAARG